MSPDMVGQATAFGVVLSEAERDDRIWADYLLDRYTFLTEYADMPHVPGIA